MKTRTVTRRRILNAHDAWWFLHEHPKFQLRQQMPITAEQAKQRIARTRIRKDRNGNLWRVWPKSLDWQVIEHNLNIHYTVVDERGRINDDPSKNKHQACWLEFGPMYWGYHTEWETKEREYRIHTHDVDLDCGAATFDAALVKLARLAQQKYGDFPVEDWQIFRPKRGRSQEGK